MILSMTGFGEASLDDHGHAFHVEIRSVNNRYLKVTTRLPESFEFLETELESLIRKRVTRGSLTVKLFYRDLSAEAAQQINVAAIQNYLKQFEAIMRPSMTIDVAALASLPGVVQPPEVSDEQREHGAAIALKLTDQAIENLIASRAAEGRVLCEDLRKHCGIVRENLAAIEGRSGTVVGEFRDRLMQRIRELIAGSNVTLAEEDLLKEVSIYAERSDISEEISRLRSHLDQFDANLVSKEPAGRRLDFISQEMLREANTIGSKAGDASIARCTIEIKAAIDRIKEQVQNAE
ncbi:MAG: YicC/YloC family endoribonuclease [Phycisphaerae bacterium]